MNFGILKRNWSSLLVIGTLFLFFLITVYYSSTQLYEKELISQEEIANARVYETGDIVKTFFFGAWNDISFLSDLPEINQYKETGLKDIYFRESIKAIFYDFMNRHEEFFKLRILDADGKEVIRVDRDEKGMTMVIPEIQLQSKNHRYYFKKTIELDEHERYVSPIDLNMEHGKVETPYVPTIRMALPLFDKKKMRKGIFVGNISLKKLVHMIPEEGFIKTEEGNFLAMNSDGTVDFRKSEVELEGEEGEFFLDDDTGIHYRKVEFLPGNWLTVAAHDKGHSIVKILSMRLIVISLGFTLLFLLLITFIGYREITRARELIDAHKAIIFSLADLTEQRDPETGDHLERTRHYTVILAKNLSHRRKFKKSITTEFIDDLYTAAPLHDIGKVGVKDKILLKEGSLTKPEFEEMKKHAGRGREIIENILEKFRIKLPVLEICSNICGYHHEKFNGEGYPEGLKGNEIPLEARIFSICDVYDALRSKRPYKDQMPHEKVVQRISQDMKSHYDPDILEAFLECQKKFREISDKYSV